MTTLPAKRAAKGAPLGERIRSRSIEQADGCVLWQGYIDRDGYGRISVSRPGRTYRPTLVHRALLIEISGPISDRLVVDHTCHNADLECAGGPSCLHRRCVNPDHLEAVTPAVNKERGRHAKRVAA